MQAPSPLTITLLVVIPLLAWRVYARLRRMVGRQRYSPARPWITLVVFPALAALVAVGVRGDFERLAWLTVGLIAGAGLGAFGLAKTRFERTPSGMFYTPQAHLGIALTTVFVARIVYRIVEVSLLEPDAAHGMQDFGRSRLTLAVFGLLAGYYVAYALGLVRWRLRVLRARHARAAVPPADDPSGPDRVS